MIAKLEFDCSIPEEAEKMKRALLADDLCSVIYNMNKHLMDELKEAEHTSNRRGAANKLFIELSEQLENKGINLDDIYS